MISSFRIHSCLRFDPRERLSATEALCHPYMLRVAKYFKKVHEPAGLLKEKFHFEDKKLTVDELREEMVHDGRAAHHFHEMIHSTPLAEFFASMQNVSYATSGSVALTCQQHQEVDRSADEEASATRSGKLTRKESHRTPLARHHSGAQPPIAPRETVPEGQPAMSLGSRYSCLSRHDHVVDENDDLTSTSDRANRARFCLQM